jgi:hypothetical protein
MPVVMRTWGDRAGPVPSTEYWRDVIPAVKASHPDFIFIAEAYWDLEWELQQQGFDYCYDKRLYDRLVHDDAGAVRGHLWADLDYQKKLLRFIENHDEPRAAATFSPAKHRAAAVTFSTIPGARLVYDGQMSGRRVRLPVFLGRQPAEGIDGDLSDFYDRLLHAVSAMGMDQGEWKLCETSGWPDNQSHDNLVAWSWRSPDSRSVVVVNLSDGPAQARLWLPWDELKGNRWSLNDRISGVSFERDGDDIATSGLYIALDPWGSHILQFHPQTAQAETRAAVMSKIG